MSKASTAALISERSLPAELLPREKLLRLGAPALADDELLALLLGTGRAGLDARGVARELLARYSLRDLLSVSAHALARWPGLGEAKAARLSAAVELGRRAITPGLADDAPLTQPDEVAARYGPLLAGPRERFAAVALDARHHVVAERVVAMGGADHCPVPIRELFAFALEHRAAALICVHNHPSGKIEPSPEDREITRKLARAGQVLGLTLLDHLIVSGRRYTSLRARGLI